MSFICPECAGRLLRIVSSLELPPDGWWDEITLQVVECPECGFRGAAVYEESRRGALDSEVWNHRGLRLAEAPLRALIEDVAGCPEPGNADCRCATHQKWSRIGPTGRWIEVPESAGGFPLTPA